MGSILGKGKLQTRTTGYNIQALAEGRAELIPPRSLIKHNVSALEFRAGRLRRVFGAGCGVRLIFLDFFRGIGLTKWCFGCNLYSTGSKKGRCSPQNSTALDRGSAESGAGSKEKSKKLSKVA